MDLKILMRFKLAFSVRVQAVGVHATLGFIWKWYIDSSGSSEMVGINKESSS